MFGFLDLSVAPNIPSVNRRSIYLSQGDADPPSTGGKPSVFSKKQTKKVYLCNRPSDAADALPVTLIEPIFGQFVDDYQKIAPTDTDNSFVLELSREMSSFHGDENRRMHKFRRMLSSYGITLHAASVGSTKCTSDGHLMVGKFVAAIVEGKNEIGSGIAEPFLEAIMYYRKFIEILHNPQDDIAHLRSVVPCFHIIVFGACIGFVGSVFTGKIQSDVLVPIIPLFWHSTDLPMQATAARAFCALKIAIRRLERLYSEPISFLGPGEPIPEFPYPQKYFDSEEKLQEFTYDQNQELRDRLIFFGNTVGGAKICIKFVRQYSADAHRFCTRNGHAPELIAFEQLHGGWYMVVMDALDIHDDPASRRTGSYRRFRKYRPLVSDIQPLEQAVTGFIHELHAEGYVHGDLRDANLFVRDIGEEATSTDFVLLDFDWAGQAGQVHYPMHVNRREIHRPDDARDGKEILKEHDFQMVNFLFHPFLRHTDTKAVSRGLSLMSIEETSEEGGNGGSMTSEGSSNYGDAVEP
ncbi:hypothetical protein BJ138DRAFT_1018649 [Hygrophoropsis aurantiaca]|uniref:Uncharacterized protein n=1 Tax=Hygrophoropsis aurantiaca TaxID=72124 RepID=A0ACB7ZVJ2_9AGAM|nr:hypothetical protein BJ138DRAFT_1018649 [Hygrophoropsis aurantiaca]